ncbi:tripartite motif-containing protein 46 isoform X1 [Periophthalmus magnuspinnatus]|uniref:tripartite motif-containing protein 46 isoform X1 n=1 Tax=Periophthalmus magnuspinnatus TaxID=409849 RepID=UPI0024373D6A|nr:tripartite motif-containing protein 46 isoform X1 [Periophthalmus magnuspinnatus]
MAEAELQAFASIMDALVCICTSSMLMEKELHCPVCDGIVKQPILLPCQHSVCLLCAAEVLVQRGYPPPDLPPEPLSPASTPNTRSPRQGRRPPPRTPDRLEHILRTVCGSYPGRRRKDTGPPMLFPCPSCQQDVELGERGLTECLRNLTLERIVQRYRHTISLGSVAIMCGFCKPPQSLEATKGCADCKANFCNECFKLYHPWGTPRAQHEHILPTNSFRPKVLTCTVHEHEKMQWYCRHCQKLLCQYCKLRRVHHGHKVLPIAEAYQALKDRVTKQANFILANQDIIKSQIAQIEATIKQMEANSAVAMQYLVQSVRELGAAVSERQAALAQALEGTRSRRQEALSGQVSERRGLQESGGLVTLTHELLRETDPPCFVQAARVTHNRLVKAIENLQSFTLSADPSFRHFHLDASREVKLISSVNFIQAPVAPVIDTQKTLAYDQLFVCWRLPQDSAPAWHFSVEYQRRSGATGATWGGTGSPNAAVSWQRVDEVRGTSAVIERPQMDSVYVLRVRGCNKAGFGEYSEEVYLHTPPAPVLSFSLDSRWGLHADRLALGKGLTYARSVPGLSLLQAADQALTSCHLTSDLLVADLAVTQGRHYWACSVEPGSYLVKVGVGQETKLQEWFHLPPDIASPRCDPDSGHDSGAEDAQDCPSFCFLTMGMGKILLPQGHTQSHADSHSQGAVLSHSSSGHGSLSHPLTAPLPPRLGVCLDCDKGRVTFYDAHSLRVLWKGPLDCSAPVCPAFCFIGGGALQLQDLIANRNIEEPPPRRVTIQTRATNLVK